MASTSVRAEPARISSGSPELRRLNIAMLAAGMSALALLYATQALLPDLSATFGVGATAASLTVALATGTLALTVLPMSALAERFGRTRVMTAGLGLAAVTVLAGAGAQSFWLLVTLRAADGVALAAVVAVAMGHIGAEVDPDASAGAIGVYVSGTTLGGLVGRLVPAGISDVASWRWSLVVLAVVGAAGTVVFARIVPAARQSTPHAPGAVRTHLRDPGIVRLCLVALLLMGGFVATYNYLTYRLTSAPFDLSPSVVGLVFLAYLAGTVTSATAARLTARLGRRPVLVGSIVVALGGLTVTLIDALVAILIGIVIFTAGYFSAHSIASGWTSDRASSHKSHAAALYLTAYYFGSGVGGTLIGFAWIDAGWPGTVTAVAGCYVLAALIASGIRPPQMSGHLSACDRHR